MRFIDKGPLIPDELLTARDAGRVLFFCGAGVSMAGAGLPNFSDLARSVLASLGSACDSPARKLFDESEKLRGISGVSGLVPTDRIFGLLEREFDPRDVREAVAKALKPQNGHGRRKHEALLNLARGRDDVVRLVTTNFDRLFEECNSSLGSITPQQIRNSQSGSEISGIIHLHGCVNEGYDRACDDEFVLSSADFGKAYLADGWATRYIQDLLKHYNIVFVGYSADDSPVQYLLEALSRDSDQPNKLYAFQAGTTTDAAAQWEHKGVTPIAYDIPGGSHADLWKTLEAWAERARDVDAWYERVITEARAGPDALPAYKRGIVAHLAATCEGASRLATSDLPATWLCVFDPDRRYGNPGRVIPHDEESEWIDPFHNFGLDSDKRPDDGGPDDMHSRKPLDGTWSGLIPTSAEQAADETGQLIGPGISADARLSTRLRNVGGFLVRVADQPAALWWAAHQEGMHPDIMHDLEESICREPSRFTPAMRRGWQLLLAAWREPATDPTGRRYALDAIIRQDGWSEKRVCDVIELYRPILIVQHRFSAHPPASHANIGTSEIISLRVCYPRPRVPLDIPDEYLPDAVACLRKQIERGVVLERDEAGSVHIDLDTTRADDGKPLHETGRGLTTPVRMFVNMMAQLAVSDPAAAKAEFACWPVNTDPVSTRLRIWAAGQTGESMILSPAEAADVFVTLDEKAFWSSLHESDLLYALRDRWSDMSPEDCTRIEHRLQTGGYPWSEDRDDRETRNALYRLNRRQWLHNRGITFGFDFDMAQSTDKILNPDWKPEDAAKAVRPTGASSPPEKGGGGASMPEQGPDALARYKATGEFDTESWRDLLRGDQDLDRVDDISRCLAELRLDQLTQLAHPVSVWLRDRLAPLIESKPDLFETVWNALIAAMMAHPPAHQPRRRDESWVGDGLNRPAGIMAQALLRKPATCTFETASRFPEHWKIRIEQLLDFPEDARRHAIVMISPHLARLEHIDPEWTELHLLTLVDRDGPDSDAFWDGYLITGCVPQDRLFARMKKAIIAFARTSRCRDTHANRLAWILLAKWAPDQGDADPGTHVSDIELREVLIHADDDLRKEVLALLREWSCPSDPEWGERLMPFLRHVWPRQRTVRTSRMSAGLINLALSCPDRFPELVEAILPWLVPIKGEAVHFESLLQDKSVIATRYPGFLLDLIWVALPTHRDIWPYDAGSLLKLLAEQDATKNDAKLLELQRRALRR